jgi:hypothetical protein
MSQDTSNLGRFRKVIGGEHGFLMNLPLQIIIDQFLK